MVPFHSAEIFAFLQRMWCLSSLQSVLPNQSKCDRVPMYSASLTLLPIVFLRLHLGIRWVESLLCHLWAFRNPLQEPTVHQHWETESKWVTMQRAAKARDCLPALQQRGLPSQVNPLLLYFRVLRVYSNAPTTSWNCFCVYALSVKCGVYFSMNLKAWEVWKWITSKEGNTWFSWVNETWAWSPCCCSRSGCYHTHTSKAKLDISMRHWDV